MPIWRCPYCGTPQAESARCWVCRRSTTSCATCRHFRRAVASGLGLCGLDPRRTALRGTEMRPCWVATDPVPEVPARVPAGSAGGPGDPDETTRHRTFVPVEDLGLAPAEREPGPGPGAGEPLTTAAASARAAAGAGWSLWSDSEI